MLTCPYCQQDIASNHTLDCPMHPVNINNDEFQIINNLPINLIAQPKPNYYHVSWLEIAIENFKNQSDVVHTIDKSMTVGEFIRKYCKKELSKIVDI